SGLRRLDADAAPEQIDEALDMLFALIGRQRLSAYPGGECPVVEGAENGCCQRVGVAVCEAALLLRASQPSGEGREGKSRRRVAATEDLVIGNSGRLQDHKAGMKMVEVARHDLAVGDQLLADG